MSKVGRNELCPCGSGKKYKKCCESKALEAAAQSAAQRLAEHRLPPARSAEWVPIDPSFCGLDTREREIRFWKQGVEGNRGRSVVLLGGLGRRRLVRDLFDPVQLGRGGHPELLEQGTHLAAQLCSLANASPGAHVLDDLDGV